MIEEIVLNQRNYYYSGATMSIASREKALKKIYSLLLKYRQKFNQAFLDDFNKCEFDVFTTEFLLVLDECKYMIKNLKKLTKSVEVSTSIFNFPSKGYLVQEPYGVCLIMAPWNYPLQLTLEPLMGAIAAGNTAVLKPASYTKNVSQVMFEMFEEFNNPELIYVVLGGREQNQALLEQRFDYIFFTGGETVGKLVLEKASKYLTPVSLELGGKSPCIVDKDADVELAAKRIVWGKYLNAGQTCVAPDYICVHQKVHDKFVEYVQKYIQKFYYTDGKLNSNFPYLINEKHQAKVTGLIDFDKVIIGGKAEGRQLEPTVMDNVTFEDKIMSEEIFGPVMPIITFEHLKDLLEIVNRREKPLAFYYFSQDRQKAKRVMAQSPFGGGCVNDTIMHLTNENLPFGGVGRSGMGSYHGKQSFITFSHQKSVLVKGKKELNVKYPPYTEKKYEFIKKFVHIKD